MSGEEIIQSLIRRYDDTVRYRQQLLDFNFAEEVTSILQTCVKNQQAIEAQLDDKVKECEYLRECLKIAYDKVAKLYAEFENRTNHYQELFKFNYAKDILDFLIFLKTRSESNEKFSVTLNSISDDSFRHYEELLKDHFPNELINADNVKHELETLKLQFKDKTDECDQLKIRLNEANEHILTLNSELAAARESLSIEKLQRNRVESERDNLEEVLLEFKQSVRPFDEARNTSNQISPDHFAAAEEKLIGINSGIDFDHGFPISPPPDFRDDDVSVKNINGEEFFSEEEEHHHHAETNAFEETTNLSVWRKLRERVPNQCTNNFANESRESTFSLTAAKNETPIQSDVSDIKTDHQFCSVQETYDANSPVDDSNSTAVRNNKAVDVLENTVIDDSIFDSLQPLQMNENVAASKTSNKRTRKLASQADELPNSTPVQPQFASDICGNTLLKKSDLICNKRVPMNIIQSFHCEKCGKSWLVKKRGQKLAKCSNCDVRYNTRSHKNKFELISGSIETKKNGVSATVDNRECEEGSSNVRCDICGKSYSCNSSLKAHIRDVHGGKKPFECDTCGKRFARKHHLKEHTAVHGSDKPFKCSFCNECFRNPSNKRAHERVIHEGYAPFHCAHCGKGCKNKNDLISHIFAQHFPGTQKQFKCDICDKSFAIRQQLKAHKLVHMSQRPFKCSICDQRFKRHVYRLYHERNVHGESDRVHCAHCEKSYAYKMNLSRHLHTVHV